MSVSRPDFSDFRRGCFGNDTLFPAFAAHVDLSISDLVDSGAGAVGPGLFGPFVISFSVTLFYAMVPSSGLENPTWAGVEIFEKREADCAVC